MTPARALRPGRFSSLLLTFPETLLSQGRPVVLRQVDSG